MGLRSHCEPIRRFHAYGSGTDCDTRHLNEEAAKEYLDSKVLSELVRHHAQFATGDAPIFVWDDTVVEQDGDESSDDEEESNETEVLQTESSWKRVNDKPPVWMR